MNISIVGCPFQTTYGAYITSLRSALERQSGAPVQWVGSNCGCGDPTPEAHKLETGNIDYFEMREKLAGVSLIAYTANPIKRAIRAGVREASNSRRARHYVKLAEHADVMHVQQTLGSYGSDVIFHFLREKTGIARVITVHELDAEQTANPEYNLTYNQADALIVHDKAMKNKLAALGVHPDLVHVVCQGTHLAEGESVARDGLVYYGGHHFDEGKGVDVLLNAYKLLKDRHGAAAPRLRIHGHYGPTPADILAKAAELGIVDDVEWLDDISRDEMTKLYRRSAVCVLPYKRSFAGLPAGLAAANRVPIIATKAAGIPEHIGDLGIWIGGDDPTELADRIDQVLNDEAMRKDYGARLRARAETHLGWDVIGRETLKIYEIARERANRRGVSRAA